MVKLVVGCERFLLVSIYWPPDTDIVTILDELSDLEEFQSTTGGHPILLGDFNCTGALPLEIDYRLNTWLCCLNLVVVNDGPTRMHGDGSMKKLDLIIEPEHSRRQSVTLTTGWSRPC